MTDFEIFIQGIMMRIALDSMVNCVRQHGQLALASIVNCV